MTTTGGMSFNLDDVTEKPNIGDADGVGHLLYEIESLFRSIARYGDYPNDKHLTYALMNDALCHARIIIEVAWNKTSNGSMGISSLLPKFEKELPELGRVYGDICAHLSHLGEARKKSTKEWSTEGELGRVIEVALQIIDHIYPEGHENRVQSREWLKSPRVLTSSQTGL